MNRTPGRLPSLLGILLLTSALAACESRGTAEEPKDSPYALGQLMASVHAQALEEAAALMVDRPPPEELAPKLEALHGHYVQLFLSLGRRREALIAADQYITDRSFRGHLMDRKTPAFEEYTAAYKHYRELDQAIGDRIMEINLLMVYPNFAVLRQERPDEARRLGLM